MSKRPKRTGATRANPPPPSRRPGPKRSPFLLVVTAVTLVALVWIGWTLRARGTRPVAAAADSASTMDAREAAQRAIALANGGRTRESLPYFRRAAELQGDWLGHYNYAAALNNAAYAVGSRHGIATPESRDAVERLAMIRESLREFAAAIDRAPERRTMAVLEAERGKLYKLWGFPIEALESYRRSAVIDSTFQSARRLEATTLDALRGGAGAE